MAGLSAAILVVCDWSGCAGATALVDLLPADDPSSLSYRFVVDSRTSTSQPTHIYPIDFDGDGSWESYHIQRGRDGVGSLQSIVLYSCLLCGSVIQQYNFDEATFRAYATGSADVDGDGVLDVIAAFKRHDTAWVDVLPSRGEHGTPLYLCHGVDRNGKDGWDGAVYFSTTHDITGDGRPEIFIVIDTGYDLYPRRLVCVDWSRRAVLWDYEVAGIITYRHLHVLDAPGGSGYRIVFGINSKDNAASTETMDDQHGYVVALDEVGQEVWRRVTGGRYSGATPGIADYDGDGLADIYFKVTEDTTTAEGRAAVARGTTYGLVVCDRLGRTLDSIPLSDTWGARGLTIHYAGFHSDTLLSFQAGDDTLRFMTPSLEYTMKCHLPGGFGAVLFGDFLGDGSRQVMVRTRGQMLMLVNESFELLAQSVEPISTPELNAFPPSAPLAGLRLLAGPAYTNDNTTMVLRLVHSPWYTIFSRKPWLASLAAFAPPALALIFVATIMVQRKRKNAIIEKQRDELRVALDELEDAQEKLVAVEKMQQAQDIAGGVAHEIHNALYPAIASLDLLRRRLARGRESDLDSVSELLDLSEAAVARANGMTELVREFNRVDADRADEHVNLSQLISQIVTSLRPRIATDGSSFDCRVPADLAVRCRREHAFSLLNNLIVNAVDAVDSSSEKRITVSGCRQGTAVTVEIADTGPGIPESDRERVFNAYYSTKPSTGTGLGLTLARKIAEVYGGGLQIIATSPDGTRFRVTLPASTSTSHVNGHS